MTDSQPNGQLTDLLATRHRVNCPVTVNRWLANRPVNRAFVQRALSKIFNVTMRHAVSVTAELLVCTSSYLKLLSVLNCDQLLVDL